MDIYFFIIITIYKIFNVIFILHNKLIQYFLLIFRIFRPFSPINRNRHLILYAILLSFLPNLSYITYHISPIFFLVPIFKPLASNFLMLRLLFFLNKVYVHLFIY